MRLLGVGAALMLQGIRPYQTQPSKAVTTHSQACSGSADLECAGSRSSLQGQHPEQSCGSTQNNAEIQQPKSKLRDRPWRPY